MLIFVLTSWGVIKNFKFKALVSRSPQPLKANAFCVMEEIWKAIPNYEGRYEVSNLGRVKSLPIVINKSNGFIHTTKLKVLKSSDNCHGYLTVYLTKNKVSKTRKVHQLVAEAFLEHIPDGTHKLVVNHINFIRHDNRLCNLEVVTSRENANQKHMKSSSEYIGVSWDKQNNKWKSQIYINNTRTWLGRYTHEIDAHLAYQKALAGIKNNQN